jgi:hypothetical protein
MVVLSQVLLTRLSLKHPAALEHWLPIRRLLVKHGDSLNVKIDALLSGIVIRCGLGITHAMAVSIKRKAFLGFTDDDAKEDIDYFVALHSKLDAMPRVDELLPLQPDLPAAMRARNLSEVPRIGNRTR